MLLKRVRMLAASALALGLLAIHPASAQDLPPARSEPILEIAGRIAVTNTEGAAEFDRDMIERFGMVEVVTATPWHKGVVRFEGVPVQKLLDAVGAKGRFVKATALNDYVTTIPVEDFARYGVILALKKDGDYMSVREKGPLFIVYPYDSDPSLKAQMYYARSAWQVRRLDVQP